MSEASVDSALKHLQVDLLKSLRSGKPTASKDQPTEKKTSHENEKHHRFEFKITLKLRSMTHGVLVEGAIVKFQLVGGTLSAPAIALRSWLEAPQQRKPQNKSACKGTKLSYITIF